METKTSMTDEHAIHVLETMAQMFAIKSRKDSKDEFNLLAQEAILQAISALKRPKVTYICKDKGNDYCHHTSYVNMARNFEKVGDNAYQEMERQNEI